MEKIASFLSNQTSSKTYLQNMISRPDLLLFGTKETDFMCGKIYEELGSPRLSPRVGWAVFSDMVTYYIEKYATQN